MQTLLSKSKNELEVFKFSPNQQFSDFDEQKKAFLKKLKRFYPESTKIAESVRPNCFFIFENTAFYCSQNGFLWSINLEKTSAPILLDQKKLSNFLVPNNVFSFYSICSDGKIIQRSTENGFILDEIETPYTSIRKIIALQDSKLILTNKCQIVIIDFLSKKCKEMHEHQLEKLEFMKNNEWKAIEIDILNEDFEFNKIGTFIRKKMIFWAKRACLKYKKKTEIFLQDDQKVVFRDESFSFLINQNHNKFRPRFCYSSAQNILFISFPIKIVAYDFATYNILDQIPLHDHATSLGFDDISGRLIIGFENGLLKLYNITSKKFDTEFIVPDGMPIKTINTGFGFIITGSKNGCISLWNSENFQKYMDVLAFKTKIKKDENEKKWSFVKNEITFEDFLPALGEIHFDNNTCHLYAIVNQQLLKWSLSDSPLEIENKFKNFKKVITDCDVLNPNIFYSVSKNDQLMRFDIVNNEEINYSLKKEEISCINYSALSQSIVIGEKTGFIEILTLPSLKLIKKERISKHKISLLRFFKNNYIILCDIVGGLFIYDIKNSFSHGLPGHSQEISLIEICQEQNIIFTFGLDLQIKKWDLKLLDYRTSPSLSFSITVDFPVLSMIFDLKTDFLYYSQSNTVVVLDCRSQEVVQTIFSNEEEEKKQKSETIKMGKNSFNRVSFINLLLNFEKALITHIVFLNEHNVLAIFRTDGVVNCHDLNNDRKLENFTVPKKILWAKKHSSSDLIFCMTENGLGFVLNLFKITIKTYHYIQSISNLKNNQNLNKNIENLALTTNQLLIANKIIHPLLFALLHNNVYNISPILKEWQYPKLLTFQESPIVLCLNTNHTNFSEALFEALEKYEKPIIFTANELFTMMANDFIFVKMYLTKVCEPVDEYTNTHSSIKRYNHLLQNITNFKSKTGHFFKTNFDQLKIDSKALESKEKSKSSTLQLKSLDNQNKTKFPKVYTGILRINAMINPDKGSEDALKLLAFYSQSSIDGFILSFWSKIIELRWQSNIIFSILIFAMYFLYLIFNTLFFIFNDDISLLLAILLTLLNLIYEIPLMYFHRKYTKMEKRPFVKICNYIANLVAIFLVHYSHHLESDVLKGLVILVQAINYFEGIPYLRIFSYMREISIMVNVLIYCTMDIVLIVIYFMTCFTILFKIHTPAQNFYNIYINTFFLSFGNFPDTDNLGFLEFLIIATFVFTISMIVFNFLISQMSNKHANLIEIQKTLGYKAMARILFEYEIWYGLFFKSFGAFRSVNYYIFKEVDPKNVQKIEKDDENENENEKTEMMIKFTKRIESLENKIDKLLNLGSLENKNQVLTQKIDDIAEKQNDFLSGK